MSERKSSLHWRTVSDIESDRANLRKLGVKVIEYRDVFDMLPTEHDTQPRSLQPPGAGNINWLKSVSPVALLGVPLNNVADLQICYGYLVEPAFRNDLSLWIYATKSFSELAEHNYVDAQLGFSWTLERLQYLTKMFGVVQSTDGLPPMTPIEQVLYSKLSERGWSPQPQYGIKRYSVDLAFPAFRIAVECDGRGFHDKTKDKRRDAHLQRLGWATHRFTGTEIWYDPDGVVEEIEAILNAARQLIQQAPTRPEELDLPNNQARGFFSSIRLVVSWFGALFCRRRAPDSRDLDLEEGLNTDSELAPSGEWLHSLDSEQTSAVLLPDGVSQVLAPAGSGKTRVLAARVPELMSRGVPANRILCVAFNQDARDVIRMRMGSEGVPLDRDQGVACLTFHGLGWRILKYQNLLPHGQDSVRTLNYAQLRRLATIAMKAIEDGEFIDAPTAQQAISEYKLARRVTPAEASTTAQSPWERTAAEIYRLHEEEHEKNGTIDYDDLILKPLQLLQENSEVRRDWQSRWHHVLVDEYQDIEPAQELLIRIISAPEDNLTVVGDEDQCIYTWRRADVTRIVDFHYVYPGLSRTQVVRNYRCPPDVVEAATELIERNVQRFPKQILPGRHDANEEPAIQLHPTDSLDEEADCVASIVESALSPGDGSTAVNGKKLAVLARTTELITQVAHSLADLDIGFDAPQRVVEAQHGAVVETTVIAYLNLISAPTDATAEHLTEAMRIPNRYLTESSARQVERVLRKGSTFVDAFSQLNTDEWRVKALIEGGDLLDRLAHNTSSETSAAGIIRELRSAGRLDREFANREQMTPHDADYIDTLNRIESQGESRSLLELASYLERRQSRLREMSDSDGVRLRTIHGAKGQQWPHVILAGCDESVLPHRNAISPPDKKHNPQIDPADPALKVEEERRLCYVAFTRTQERLDIVYDENSPSRFLTEAGLQLPEPEST